MSPPPQLCFPFASSAKKSLTQHPNDSASTATLTSYTSAATKLHFTEDTDSYFGLATANTTPPGPSRSNSNGSNPFSSEKIKSPNLQRMFTWRRHDSTSTLVSDEPLVKKGAIQEDEEPVDTTPRLAALRKKMAEEGNIDYLYVTFFFFFFSFFFFLFWVCGMVAWPHWPQR